MNSAIRLYLKNEAFETVGVIQQASSGLTFKSLEWESVFHKQDSFTIECGVRSSDLADIALAPSTAYIVRNDTLQIAKIERREFDGRNLIMEGIGVEGLLAKRFTKEEDFLPVGVNEGQNFVGAVMCDIINSNKPFSWLVADRAKNMVGPSIATYTEINGNVYKYLKMLAQAYDIGIRCVFDEENNRVNFSAYGVVGIDVDIAGRTYIISDELDNAKEPNYEYDTSKYYNYARVVGEDGFSVPVDHHAEGEEVYEYSFKSKSRRKDKTDAEYSMILYDEGVQELAKRRIDEFFVMQPEPGAKIELGWETKTIGKNINKATQSFCTEIRETWEETVTREYTFGYKTDEHDELVISLQGEMYNG